MGASFFPLDELPVRSSGGLGDEDFFCELIPAAESKPSRTGVVFPKELSAAEIKLTEQEPRLTGPIGFFKLSDVVCGLEGLPWHKEQICYSRTFIQDYYREMLEAEPPPAPGSGTMPVREITRPVVLPMNRDYNNYGHWWLDIAPRMYALWRYRPELFAELGVVLPANLSAWGKEILQAVFGLEESRFEVYRPRHEMLRCRTAVIPTMMHREHYFHPAAAKFYQHVIDLCPKESAAGKSGMLFLTRRSHVGKASWRARMLTNAAEAEALAVSLGYELVAPEELPWREQVAMFSRAKVVAGEHGSAMKNLLFAPAGATAVVINHLNVTQATIAAFKDQRLLTVAATGFNAAAPTDPYTVDIGKLKACLEEGKRLSVEG